MSGAPRGAHGRAPGEEEERPPRGGVEPPRKLFPSGGATPPRGPTPLVIIPLTRATIHLVLSWGPLPDPFGPPPGLFPVRPQAGARGEQRPGGNEKKPHAEGGGGPGGARLLGGLGRRPDPKSRANFPPGTGKPTKKRSRDVFPKGPSGPPVASQKTREEADCRRAANSRGPFWKRGLGPTPGHPELGPGKDPKRPGEAQDHRGFSPPLFC